jgi:FMN phosphatase YigB (HAD superfamily)
MIKSVIFDLYDTLVTLPSDSILFQQLARRDSVFNVRKAIEIALTSDNPTLGSYAASIGLPPQEDLNSLEAGLHNDLSQVQLFPDAISALTRLKEQGIATDFNTRGVV